MGFDWTMAPWVSIDVESTGVHCYEDRIVEIACVGIGVDGEVIDPWSAVVNPGVEIPDEAAAIHGITTERAEAEGITTAEALTIVADRIFENGWRSPVIAYNARYDLPMILAEAERHGVDFPAFAPILDPYLLDRMADKYRRGKRQLTLVADHYGVALGDNAHGALADAIAAGQVMRKLIAKYPQIGDHSLGDLFVRQAKGHETQRQSFEEYMRRTKDPDFEASIGWPIPTTQGTP